MADTNIEEFEHVEGVAPHHEDLPTEDHQAGNESAAATGTRPSLTVKRAGVETDEVFAFSTPAVVGRFDPSVGPVDVDLGNIPEGTYVSRKHARIDSDGEGFKIVDLGSSNGTFVLRDGDFARVDEAPLAEGLEIALGNARFVFHLI